MKLPPPSQSNSVFQIAINSVREIFFASTKWMSQDVRRAATERRHYRSIRLALMIALVAISAVAFGTNNSAGGSLDQLLSTVSGVFAHKQPAITVKAAATTPTFASEAAEAALTPSTTMSRERRGHTATRLNDGTVLIAGGENASGVLNETETYDQTSGTFSVAGNMREARADHTATLLSDGRVLIAGGRNAVGPVSTTEIFDPATGAFASGPSLSSARAGHSATLFTDGRILIAGGDANGDAEIIDASLSGSMATGSMTASRSNHSAALLLDGRVLVVGGHDASGTELSSGEIFDNGSFSAIDGSLRVARTRAHLRVLFDGKVQIIGGSNDGSMEIYDPSIETFGAYAHVSPEGDTCAGLPGQIQASQTRAALFHNGQSDSTFDRSRHTMNELGSQAIVIGGVNSAETVLNSSVLFNSSNAQISTDKLDYQPGETAHISGRGFQPGETVRLKIHEDPHTPQERGMDVVADGDGTFVADYLVTEYDFAMKFLLGARGLASGATAQTTFTDGVVSVNILSPTIGSPATVTALPAVVTVSFNYRTNGSGGPITFTINIRTGSTIVGQTNGILARANGAGGANVSFPVNIPAGTPNGSYAVDVIVTDNSGTGSPATNSDTENNAVNINAPVLTTLSLAPPSPSSVPFGSTGPVSLSATLLRQVGGAVGGATITFRVDGAPVGTAVTNASGVATLSTYNPSALNAGPHTVQATFAGQTISGTTYVGSTSGTQTLTINKRDTLTTVSSSLNASTYGQSVTFTATVAGTGAGAGNPIAGLVQFKIDNVNFGGPVPLSAGSATSSAINSLTTGNHTVEATFSAIDPNFNNSSDLLDGGQTVNKAHLTVTADNKNKTYDGAVYSPFTSTITGFVLGQTDAGLRASGDLSGAASYAGSATTVVNFGTYVITPTLGTLAATNYDFTPFVDGSLTIDKAHLTVTADNKTKTYDAAVFTAFTSTITGFVNSETETGLRASGALSGAAAYTGSATTAVNSSVTPYTITPTLGTLTATNYDFTTFVDGNLTIDQRLATWTTNPNSKTYGDPDPTPLTTGSGSNFIASDNVTATYTRDAGENASPPTYHITATLSATGDLNNYIITNEGAEFTINKRLATWTTNPNSKTYGDPDPTPLTTGSGSNFIASDNVTATYTRDAGENASPPTYHITATLSATGDLNNYIITNEGAEFTINKRTLTASIIGNPTKVYDGNTDATLTPANFLINNLVAGQTITVTKNSGGYNSKDVATASSVTTSLVNGDFTAGAGTDLNNYNLPIGATGPGSITPRPLTIKAEDKSMLFGLSVPTFTATYDTFVGGDTPSSLGGTLMFTVKNLALTTTITVNASTPSGTYAIVPSGLTSTNYTITFSNGLLTINSWWTLTGFYQPVDMNIGSTFIVNIVKGGSTVPLKFNIYAGTPGPLTERKSLSDVMFGSVQVAEYNCGATPGYESPLDVSNTGGTSLRYDTTGNQFIQNWQTPKTANKCYQVRMTALDGSHIDAYFKTK